MPNVSPTPPTANVNGGLWMIAAMGAFAIEDAFVKSVSATLPLAQILILFGLGGALVFAGLAVRNNEPLYTSDVLSAPMRLRLGFEIMGRLFYILAIILTPLSSATVILQATPIVVVAAAALLFGEQVSWRRWGAILAGAAAYGCLMKAMRTGDVSAVTPFRYTRLIFGITLGVVFFGETLSVAMLIGSGLIVLSGLFILARGKSWA